MQALTPNLDELIYESTLDIGSRHLATSNITLPLFLVAIAHMILLWGLPFKFIDSWVNPKEIVIRYQSVHPSHADLSNPETSLDAASLLNEPDVDRHTVEIKPKQLPEPVLKPLLKPLLKLGNLKEQIRSTVALLTMPGDEVHDRQMSFPKHTFSVADFRNEDPAEPAQREAPGLEWIDQIDLNPTRLVSGQKSGRLTYRIKDVFGNFSCLQQRGDPFDPTSWLWHRVPGSECAGLE